MKSHEIDVLAQFMGHDIRIHRTHYRLPERTLEAAKISKLLFAADRGALAEFDGMSLDDMEVTEKDGKICLKHKILLRTRSW